MLGRLAEDSRENNFQPIAKTRLRWSVFGGVPAKLGHLQNVFHVTYLGVDQQLHKLVKEHFLMQNLDLSPLRTKLKSTENKRARQILESTTRSVTEGFKT